MIVDTNILIDFSRNYTAAIEFFMNHKKLYISAITSFEMIAGCKTRKQLKVFETFLNEFHIEVLHINDTISKMSLELCKKYHFGNHSDLADNFIAGTASYFNLPLVTLNTKHFQYIKEIKVLKPY
jgi:tRNA(fMet)-specific endonuclease VapC